MIIIDFQFALEIHEGVSSIVRSAGHRFRVLILSTSCSGLSFGAFRFLLLDSYWKLVTNTFVFFLPMKVSLSFKRSPNIVTQNVIIAHTVKQKSKIKNNKTFRIYISRLRNIHQDFSNKHQNNRICFKICFK